MKPGLPVNTARAIAPRCTRRKFLQKTVGAAMMGATPGALPSRARPGTAKKVKTTLRWKAHDVAKIPHGYQVAVADVNGDGQPDILALSSEQPIVEWYEYPGWRARSITTKTEKNISVAPLFRAGRPSPGVALAANFSLGDSLHGGNLWWAARASSPEAEWPLEWIGRLPTSHRLRWADLDGDGRLELINAPLLGPGAHAPGYAVGAPLTWFAMPEARLRGHASASVEPGAHGTNAGWESHLIDNTLTVIHGLNIVDWDGDGRDEILTASFEGVHLFRSTGRGRELRWTKVHLAAGDQPAKVIPPGATGGAAQESRRGSSEISVGRIGGRRFLATIEPWHGEQVVVYLEPPRGAPGELWSRHVIDASFLDGHALACADLNGDGNDEIVAGFRGKGTSLYIYSASDSTGLAWERQTLDSEMAAAGVAIHDLNGDGRLDVIAIGASTGNVKWYEHLGSM